jgi:phenylacetate-CoA ligase
MQRVVNPAVETLTRPEIEQLQLRRLTAQLARCSKFSDFYSARWGADVIDIRSLDDFRSRVPLMTKIDVLKEQREHGRSRVVLKDSRPVFTEHLTSGTLGLGQEVHPLTMADNEAFAFSWPYQTRWAGFEVGDVALYTTPLGLTGGGQYAPLASLRMLSHGKYVSSLSTEDKLDLMLRDQPHGLVALPSYITRLTVLARSRGVDPRVSIPSLKAFFIAGESYPMSWAEEIQDFWGITLSEWYGSTQTGCNLAITCERGVVPDSGRGVMHCMEHRVLCEVVDSETRQPVAPGGFGELVVTSLFREAFPLVRFLTGDRVRVVEQTCPCGRELLGFETGTVSRVDDMLKIKGQNVWPSAVDDVVLAHPDVEDYSGAVVLDDRGAEDVIVSVRFIATTQLSDSGRREVLDRLAADVRHRVGVRVTMTEDSSPQVARRIDAKARRWCDLRHGGREDR